MRIPIVPIDVLSNGGGLVKVVHVEVRCVALELGEKARFTWEAQSVETTGNPFDAKMPIERATTRASGHYDLSHEEYSAWKDDTQIAKLVVQKAGCTPA